MSRSQLARSSFSVKFVSFFSARDPSPLSLSASGASDVLCALFSVMDAPCRKLNVGIWEVMYDGQGWLPGCIEWRGGSKSPAVVDVSSSEFKKSPGLMNMCVRHHLMAHYQAEKDSSNPCSSASKEETSLPAHHPQGLEGMEGWGAVRHCFA